MRNIYFIVFNRYPIRKNTTKYSKSQQTTEVEEGHFLYFDCKWSKVYQNREMSVRFEFESDLKLDFKIGL